MPDDEPYGSPEHAAAAMLSGQTLDVDVRGDGRWAVVVRRHHWTPWFVLCKLVADGWVVEDDGEMASSQDSISRATWMSLTDADDSGPNLGVEIAWGSAPPGTARGLLRTADRQEFAVSIHDGIYWLVRWGVSDDDDVDHEPIEFAAV
jgi:hypothetical protein